MLRSAWSTTKLLGGVVLFSSLLSAQDCHFEFADVSSSGVQANQLGLRPQVSGDGRFVAFESNASNLVPGDTNSSTDVFVRDLLNQTTERVNFWTNGAQAAAGGTLGGISYDGRYVVFTTGSDLDPLDQNGLVDVYVRDRVASSTEWISVPILATGLTASSAQPAISPDGRFVTFVSRGTNFVPGDPADWADAFLRDRLLGTTILVSQSSSGAWGDRDSAGPKVSADGNKVVFSSSSSTFDPGTGTTFNHHVYLRDVLLGTTLLIDKNPMTGEVSNVGSGNAVLTPDGSLIAFQSGSTNLFPNQVEYKAGPILWSESGTLTWVEGVREIPGFPFTSSYYALSEDGRYVSFAAQGPTWTGTPQTAGFGTYLADLWTGVLSDTAANGPANPHDKNVQHNSMSWDGSTIAFSGQAENLVPGTGTLFFDRIFVRVCDLVGGVTYCYPTKSPIGCLPRLTGHGTPSASAGSGHELLVRDAVNDQIGLVVYGTTGSVLLPWNGGFLCLVPQARLAAQATGGSQPPTVDCTGTFSVDFSAWISSGVDPSLVVGAPVYAQAWVRDSSHPAGALLSDAAAFVVGP